MLKKGKERYAKWTLAILSFAVKFYSQMNVYEALLIKKETFQHQLTVKEIY